MENRVGTFIEKEKLLDKGCRTIIALSGGADSVALLRILLSLGYETVAVHCNFHLRGPESMRDERFVRDLCNGLNVKLHVCNYNTAEYAAQHHLSIEMAARELRYADFHRIAREEQASAICVAHHRDDNVETVLLNLIRGTGLKGLAGIQPKNGMVVRPLLCVSRQEIEAYLTGIGQDYVTDSTNLETDFTRNKIRLQLLPIMREMNPSASESIDRTSQNVRNSVPYYVHAISDFVDRAVTEVSDGLDIRMAQVDESPNAGTLLHEILSPFGFSLSQIQNICNSSQGSRFIAGKYCLYRDREKLLLRKSGKMACGSLTVPVVDGASACLENGKRISLTLSPKSSPVSKSPNVATFDAGLIGQSITIRPVRQGDSFVPFGMKGRKLLSDFMTDLKMSIPDKQNQLVVCDDDDNIIWVIGHRSDDRYKVRPETEMQLVLTLKD